MIIFDCLGPEDYMYVSDVVTFDIGEEYDLYCLYINIIDDDICEEDESFSIQLTSTDDCVDIVDGSGSLTIIDDDGKFKL